MLRKIMGVSLLAFALDCAAANYADWWWNPSQSGHGLNIGQQGNTIFLSWFTYDETGNDMWVVMSGQLNGNVVQGNFLRLTGPRLGDPFNPAQVNINTVGTAKVTFTSLHSATFDWMVNAKSGSVALVRDSFGYADPSGDYIGAPFGKIEAIPIGCPLAGQTGETRSSRWSVAVDASNNFNMSWTTPVGNLFTFKAPIANSGEWLALEGTYTSTNPLGPTGTFNASVLMVDDTIIFSGTLFPVNQAACPGIPLKLTGGRNYS